MAARSCTASALPTAADAVLSRPPHGPAHRPSDSRHQRRESADLLARRPVDRFRVGVRRQAAKGQLDGSAPIAVTDAGSDNGADWTTTTSSCSAPRGTCTACHTCERGGRTAGRVHQARHESGRNGSPAARGGRQEFDRLRAVLRLELDVEVCKSRRSPMERSRRWSCAASGRSRCLKARSCTCRTTERSWRVVHRRERTAR